MLGRGEIFFSRNNDKRNGEIAYGNPRTDHMSSPVSSKFEGTAASERIAREEASDSDRVNKAPR
jgi:hypothetical protein